ncbi:MAG: hypothetical protein KDJ15_04170, partial [Alphaproteobacteria bacterium]|nr:hypothetical protein [Alphaproteobacteria bacterium]
NAKNRVLAFLFAAMFLCLTPRPSQALLLLESYVFMNERSGSAVMTVKNTEERPLAYRLSWEQVYMTPDRGRQIDRPDVAIENVKAADPYLYMSPRRMVIQPRQMQSIRFMLRREKDLPPGEYRSYIFLQPEKIADLRANNDTSPRILQGQGVQLDMLAGYRLPVFFLNGETTLDVSFTDIRAGKNRKGKDALFFTMNRTGTRSAIGKVDVVCDKGTAEEKLLVRKDVKIFTELNRRDFSAVLEAAPSACKTITLSFVPHIRDPDYKGGQPMAVAQWSGP